MDIQKYALSEHALFQKVVDEAVILETNSGNYYTFDEISTYMLELILKPTAEDEIVESIVLDYGVNPVTVKKDLDDFMNELIESGLLIYNKSD